MLFLMFVRLTGWIVLLVRSSASKDGAGPATVTKRSTRGTSVITSDLERIRARIKDKRVLALGKAFLKAGVLTETGDREDTYTGTRKEASCPR
jgi:hypothetical protein